MKDNKKSSCTILPLNWSVLHFIASKKQCALFAHCNLRLRDPTKMIGVASEQPKPIFYTNKIG
jgi:hypothetical protein